MSRVAPLGEYLELVTYGFTNPMPDAEVGPWKVTAKDVIDGKINYQTARRTTQKAFNEDLTDKSRPKIGDVLLTKDGTLGRLAVVREEGFCVNQSVAVLRPNKNIDSDFLFYLLASPKYQHKLLADSDGSVLKHIYITRVPKMEVEVPALDVQKKIVHILRSFDEKIELNRQINTTLKSMAQALFKSWFVDFDPVIDNALAAGNPIPDELSARAERRKNLRENPANPHPPLPADIQRLFPSSFVFTEEMGWVPEGWEANNFGNVSTCYDNKRIPLSKKQREEKKPGIIPYYGATSVMDYVNEWIFDDIYLLIGEDGSVIKDDGTPFTQYIWGRSWVNNHAHVLQGKNGVSTEHLMLFMQQQNMSAYVTGAVQLKINQKNMNSIPFLKAPNSLNAYFGQLINPYYERYRDTCDQIEVLAQIRDSLLPKLLSGQLQIPEAEQQLAKAM